MLVTGATGFIGSRLVRALLDEGYGVRCLVRRANVTLPPGVEKVEGDLLERLSLAEAMTGIDTAYYLVHSMDPGQHDFSHADRKGARNMARVAELEDVERIIYLGGLGGADDPNLSEHLRSRFEVARILHEVLPHPAEEPVDEEQSDESDAGPGAAPPEAKPPSSRAGEAPPPHEPSAPESQSRHPPS